MAQLDVSEVLLDPDFADIFDVLRRTETVNGFGESTISIRKFRNVVGVVQAGSNNKVVREADQQHMAGTISVITRFRLRGVAPDSQPDAVSWKGSSYLVMEVSDFTNYGFGFIEAVCSSEDFIDAAAAWPPVNSE